MRPSAASVLALSALALWGSAVVGCAASTGTFVDGGAPSMGSDGHDHVDASRHPTPSGDASQPLLPRLPPPAERDGGVDVGSPVANCTPVTSQPNGEGIGGYCTPSGGQCDTAGPGGMGTTCTADLPDAPPNGWFCTFPCVTAATCGTDAVCDVTPQGQECIPVPCEFLVDGGFRDGATGTGPGH